MFESINGATRLRREFFEPDPDEESTAKVMTLHARLTTLTTFEPRALFACAMQLLNLPTEAARLLCRLSGMLSQLVGHNVGRAVGRHRNPEPLHLVVFGKAFDLDALAVLQCVWAPSKRVHTPIRLTVAGIIHLAIVLEWAVREFFAHFNPQHELFGSVPRVHQDRLKGQGFLLDHIGQPLTHVIECAFAVTVRIIHPGVNQPDLVGVGIDIDTGHHPDAY